MPVSRRDFLGAAAAAVLPLVPAVPLFDRMAAPQAARPLRIRTITAGVALGTLRDLGPVERAIGVLERARRAFQADDYVVQTLRIALPPLLGNLSPEDREAALAPLRALDTLAKGRDVLVGIGPVLAVDRDDPELPEWALELVRTTTNLNFSVLVASATGGIASRAAAAAAQIMATLSKSTPGGLGNFRLAAAANVPAGTPFFPVAWHEGADSLAIGLESASLVGEAAANARTPADAGHRIRERLDAALGPIERTGLAIARQERCAYLGIDTSPAPGKDRSIGAAVEVVSGVPFGSAATLDACAVITAALKALRVRTCGYAGLMLPVLEDPVLATRATEGRYGLPSLLLYSSVCGTGLDVVPIPGDTPVEVITRIVLDVATLSDRLHKPLSARLFPIPGKRAGEIARFDDPFLTDAAVLPVA